MAKQQKSIERTERISEPQKAIQVHRLILTKESKARLVTGVRGVNVGDSAGTRSPVKKAAGAKLRAKKS